MNTRWKYILLGVGVFLFEIVLISLSVASYFHIPLASLLPSGPWTKSIPISSPTPRTPKEKYIPPPPVRRITIPDGRVMYLITGKFVTNPTYNTQQVLQGDFVIDGDPTSHTIPVVMTSKTGHISVLRTLGSSVGKITAESEDTESFRQSITAPEPAQLRLYTIASGKSANDMIEEKVLDGIIAGNWSIPNDFVIDPPMIVVVQ
jgi:hypothetical protein